MTTDFRHSVRTLFKQPLFSVIVILTFALGIGANTAVFSVVNAVLLRPLPFHQPQNLVALAPYDIKTGPIDLNDKSACSYPDFADWRAQNHVFENIAVYRNQALTLTTNQEAMHLQGETVSAALFNILGVKPILGRTFLEKEDEVGNRVVLLSYGLWQRQFAGDPTIVGKSITLDGEIYQVVGVMPAGFTFPIAANAPEIWTTMSIMRATRDGSQPMTEQRGNSFLNCIARLKPGISMQQAQADLDVIVTGLRQQYPDLNTNTGVKILSLGNAMVADSHSALLMLCTMAGCVLLVACVNVANLLLARSISRQREISIRAALGAGRWRLVKQMVTESAVLGVCGGIAGLALATWGLDTLKAFLPTTIPRVDQIAPDMRVLGFTALVSLAIGAFAGLLPAWRASHPNLVVALNESARGSTESVRGRHIRALLVIIEIVLALVLLASAGLLGESFVRLQKVRPGFDSTNVLTARIALPDANYEKPAQAIEFFKQLLARVSALPGVNSAAACWWFPLSGSEVVFSVDIQERPLPKAQQQVAQVNVVTHEYFKTTHTAISKGRDFTERDDAKAPKVAIVSEAFARQFFPGEDPIGKRITPSGSTEPGDPPVREIVGVVQDIHLISLRDAPKPQVYIPHPQFPIQSVTLLVRAQNDPRLLAAAIHKAVNEIDRNVPLYRTRLFTEYVSQSVAQPRLNALLVGLFALLALLLAAAGIFGVMSYSVTQRTQEIGIRLALGAQRSDVLRLIVGQGMRLVVIGVVCGFAGIVACTRLLQSLLFGIGATDLPTFASVAFLLGMVALIACLLPAMRASKVDPVIALRAE